MLFAIPPDLDDPKKYPKSVRRAAAERRQSVWDAFREHKERLRPLLPPPLQQLQEANIHDARIRLLRIDAVKRTVRLNLTCCDTPGCFDLSLHYKNIDLTPQEISLLCFIAHDESSEIYWGEVDIDTSVTPPVFIHRILWQTGIRVGQNRTHGLLYSLNPEIELRFGGFSLNVKPNPDGNMSRRKDFIKVVYPQDWVDPVGAGWLTADQEGNLIPMR